MNHERQLLKSKHDMLNVYIPHTIVQIARRNPTRNLAGISSCMDRIDISELTR